METIHIYGITPEEMIEMANNFGKRPPRPPGMGSSQRTNKARQDVRIFIEAGDEKKLLETLQMIMDKGWNECLGPSLANAINFFCDRKNLEQAKALVTSFKVNCPNGYLDKYKIVKYTKLLIENNQFEDALIFLDGEESLGALEKRGINRLVESVIKAAQRTRDEEKISKLRALLETKNFM